MDHWARRGVRRGGGVLLVQGDNSLWGGVDSFEGRVRVMSDSSTAGQVGQRVTTDLSGEEDEEAQRPEGRFRTNTAQWDD